MTTATLPGSGSTSAPSRSPEFSSRSQRLQQWMVALGLIGSMILVEIDPGSVGLGLLNRFGRLTISAAVTIPYVVLVLARATSWWSLARRAVLGAFLAWQGWAVVASLAVDRPLRTALLSLGSLGLFGAAAWLASVWSWERILTGVHLSMTLLCGLSVLLQFAGRSGRWTGVLPDWNGLGRLGAFAAVSGAAMWWRGGLLRWTGLVGVLTGLLCVWGSDSRMALVSIAGGWVILISRWVGARMAAACLLLVLVAGVAVVGGAIQGAPTLARENQYRDVSSASGRTQIWPVAIDEMLANPIAGRGTGSLERVYDEAFAEGDVAWRAFNAHNLPLNIGVAHGMVGLALFTTGVVAYVMAAFRRPVLARDSLVMVIAISGITEGVLEGPCIAVTLLGLVVGHVAARGPIDTPADHIELRRRARALRVRVGSLLPAR